MDRDYIYYEFTNSLCNECMKVVPTKIIFEDDKVYLLKYCKEHGYQKELLEYDIEYYKNKRNFDKPGTSCMTQKEVVNGCPYDCGLCEAHDQHSCISLIEITNRCNLNCNTCYADAGSGVDLNFEDITKMIKFASDSEYNKAEVLQISGGEPTLHKNIIEIIKLAKENFKHVMLNTNGLRIANDIEFVKELSKLVGGFEVYLQFDSLNNDVLKTIRNTSDLLNIKQKCIDVLNEYNIPTTLVMTVENGVNDNEIGTIISYGLENKCIRGINIQPVAYFGRKELTPDFYQKRLTRSTLTDVRSKIEEQTKKTIQKSDIIPLPCNVERVALTYLYKNKNKFVPITRTNIIQNYLPHINNTFAFNIEDTLIDGKDIVFTKNGCCSLNFLKDFSKFVPKDFLTWDIKKRAQYVTENTFRISISSFIDKYNFDTKSAQKECVHIITKDLKKIPFSTYNMIYRGQDE